MNQFIKPLGTGFITKHARRKQSTVYRTIFAEHIPAEFIGNSSDKVGAGNIQRFGKFIKVDKLTAQRGEITAGRGFSTGNISDDK